MDTIPGEINNKPKLKASKICSKLIFGILLIVVLAFILSWLFGNKVNDPKPKGLTEEERQAFLNQEMLPDAIGLTDEQKQAFFEAGKGNPKSGTE